MVRPGECEDVYYYDGDTSRKQCFPTTQNTRYVQMFAGVTGGSSVFTIPPQNGIQDVVCEFQFADLAGAPAANLDAMALPRGWGYSLIKQVSFRYGGSSQYFLTGDQILQNALRRQPSRQTADDLLTLGGNAAAGVADLSGAPLNAAIVLTLPHSSPSGVGKQNPLPTDCLTQQCQVTVELFAPNSVWSVAAGASAASVPSALSKAQFQVQQVMLNNQGDALARRVDMSVNAYAFPCEFVQQKQLIQLANTPASQSVVLTGFRSGEVKAIHCWLSRSSENAAIGQPPSAGSIRNPFNWYLPDSIQMTYAGEVYARYELASSPLWNLINGNKSPAFDNVLVSDAGGGAAAISTQGLSQWVELPFAQTLIDEDAHKILVHGKSITNGIVNLDITTPSAESDWVLNVSYIYNTTLLFSQGTADYVF
jgi:hypothetical protein